MLKIEYIPDNLASQEVFNRLLYGLKDIDGTYIQKGMPETLMFDKRMTVVPYNENGMIFRITSKDDTTERIYFLILNSVVGRFLVNEEFIIQDTISFTKDNVYGTIKSSRIDAIGVKLSSNIELSDEYIGFKISGSTSGASAIISAQNLGISKYHPHTLTVVPTDVTHPTVEQTYNKQFVPNKDITYLTDVKLSKGWNYIIVENNTTGESAELIINCRYYATIMQSIADEIYKWVGYPIEKERTNIYHYLSTRLCEMYITFKDFLPNVDTVQRLGLILSVKSLISFSGSNISTRELATAITGNTPYLSPQAVDVNFMPAIWDMYNKPQDFAGFNMNVWLRNRQVLRWITFLQYIHNVPFYQLGDVSENDVAVIKVVPFFGYYLSITLKPFYVCRNCGYWSWNYFMLCPSCSCVGEGCDIEPTYLNFKVGETVQFSNGATATIAVVYPKGLVLSHFSAVVGQDEIDTTIIGQESKAHAVVKDIPIEHHDWNRPAFLGNMDADNKFIKKLEWHQFNFSNEPLNDDWRILNCWSNVIGTLSISSILPFAICSAFHPWNRYVQNMLSYEPTVQEEAWYRTHQLDIDTFWDENTGFDLLSSSSSSIDYETITYSRHKDYPTLLDESDAILNELIYHGPSDPTIYNSLSIGATATILTGFINGSIAQSPHDLDHPVYSYLGVPMLVIVYQGKFGYISYIENQWETGIISKPEAYKNSLLWLSNMPINPTTYLPDLSNCQGFRCQILDQGVDWSYFDAPITDMVAAWTS